MSHISPTVCDEIPCTRMFPTIRVSFSGLDNKASYLILLDIVTVDNKRYRYAYHRSSWLVAGKGDPAHHSKLYSHPDSPFLGEQLRKQIITFEKVKLTNTEVNKPGYMVLNSMHRYQPRIHLVLDRGDQDCSPLKTLKSLSDLQAFDYKTFVFPECAFYSVTAYQNQLITKLKIDCNPFAKGFRDSTRVISDMERESMSNSGGGMMPDSTVFQNHMAHHCNESMSDLDTALFSQKLAQFTANRMMPSQLICSGPDGQIYPTFKSFSSASAAVASPQIQTSIPLSVLQKWSLAAGWPMQIAAMPDQRHFTSSSALDMSMSRQLLLAKQSSTGPFHPYYNLTVDQKELLHKLHENGSSIA